MQRGVLNCLKKVKQPKRGLNGMSLVPQVECGEGFCCYLEKLKRLVCLFPLLLKLNRLLTC